MSVENTLAVISKFCRKSSGDTQIWKINDTTYHWNRGKTMSDGTVNGVVRKLAGSDTSNNQIWVVAGSIKISADGAIQRFTGLSKKLQKTIEGLGTIEINATEVVTTA